MGIKQLINKKCKAVNKKGSREWHEWQGMKPGSRVVVMDQSSPFYEKLGKVTKLKLPKVVVKFGKGPISSKREFNARELKLIKDWEVKNVGKKRHSK